MDQIEVNIQLAATNKIYNLPIRKSDTILRLKEYCKILSNIPQDQQNLLYKGKKLINEKHISDYNIENDQTIMLVKKEEPIPGNIPNNQNSNNLNSNENNFNIFNNIDFSNNKEVNINEVANGFCKLPDFSFLLNNMDVNFMENITHFFGIGKFSEIFGFEPQQLNNMLKDPSNKDMLNNLLKDPSSMETLLNNPIIREKFLNNPICKLAFQNPQILFHPQYLQMVQKMFIENKKNPTENTGAENSAPPDPFGSLNNNQINQMMNSPGQTPNISTFNNNSNARNKENFINGEINIDYKGKYKEQLSQLRNMGFTNEEDNIQALKKSNGNIYSAVDKILEKNN